MKRPVSLAIAIIMATTFSITVMSASAAEAVPVGAAIDAVSIIAENEIGIAEAAKIALQDAGLTEGQVEFSKKINAFGDGKYKYEIDFIVRGNTKYDYEVDAFTGDILERDKELWEADDNMDYQGLQNAGQAFFDTGSEDVQKALEEAFQTAVKDAGVAETEIVAYQYGVGYDDGNVILEASFLIPNKMKYEYDVALATKAITDRDQEIWEAEDDMEYKNLLTPPADLAAAPAAPQDTGALDYKAIALKDAGFSEADVRMIKCEKDFDDGIEIYEVEFFGPNGMKYEYDLRASDGAILEKDAEYDD